MMTMSDDIDWSDGSGYQNHKHQPVQCIASFCKCKGGNDRTKYPETGYTKMEIDSVHSVIERNLKNKEIHCPAGYIYVMKSARKDPNPYKVKYVEYALFIEIMVL